MARTRDNQRSKLYKAEREAFEGKYPCDETPGYSVAECQEIVDKITHSRWWAGRYDGKLDVKIHAGKGFRRAVAYPWGPDIYLPLWARKEWVICHELAHVGLYRKEVYRFLYEDHSASHGPEFAKEYIAVVRRFIGAEEARALKAVFKKNRIKARAS